ncbi:MAG: arsenate reductase ArsC [Rhodobacteraceae bacterium]|nr:arsenate reductase ArsC [Paracoccaceae bacterium]
MNILILCTGNSARSILLESLFNGLGKGRIKTFSAGSKPAGTVHPTSLDLLKKKGFQTKDLRSKNWDEFAQPTAPKMDAVITVCGNARDETCPIWPGAPLKAHWGVEDPASVVKSPIAAFEVAFAMLEARAKAWLSLDFERMDQAERQHHLTRIGESSLVM